MDQDPAPGALPPKDKRFQVFLGIKGPPGIPVGPREFLPAHPGMIHAHVGGVIQIGVAGHGDLVQIISLMILGARQGRHDKKFWKIERELAFQKLHIPHDRFISVIGKTNDVAGIS